MARVGGDLLVPLEKTGGGLGAQVTQVEVAGAQQFAVSVPHFFLQKVEVVKHFEVHAGKGVAHGIFLPVAHAGMPAQFSPSTHPITRCNVVIEWPLELLEMGSRASQRYGPCATGFTGSAVYIDYFLPKINILPFQALYFAGAYTAPEHESYGGLHTLQFFGFHGLHER